MDTTGGKVLWKRGFPTRYRSGISPDNGPRCVPVIHQDAVYLYDAEGIVFCLALADGKLRWQRDLKQDYSAPEGYFGAGSTPIVEADRLLVNVGGRDGAGLVALSLASGKTLWKATDEGASYSSPVAVTLRGTRHVVFITRLNCVSVDPANGDVRFQFPFGMRGPTVNGASPSIVGDRVFLTASYGIGATMAKITDRDAQVLWQADDVMSSQYTTCVEHEGVFYGIDGRQDIGVAQLRAFDPRQGKVHWTREGFGMATIILADGKLVILKTDGTLVLAKATAEAYEELASVQLFNSTTRALPALAAGLLYARDERGLKCVDLANPE
jgi:outer membrane protein assembly factor BamB